MLYMAICDDEQEDIDNIKIIIAEFFEPKNLQYHIDTFLSGEELIVAMKSYDLIFLDIAMKGKNGIQAGVELRNIYKKTQIIFITNYDEYCNEAMNKVHAFAYLEKPVNKKSIFSQMEAVLEYIEIEKKMPVQEVCFEIFELEADSKIKSKFEKFNIDKIYYFEYSNRRVRLKLEKKEYFFREKMVELSEQMKIYDFVLCHQSYLVNLAQVKGVKGYDVFLKNGDILPLAQKKSVEFRTKLNEYIQKNM